MRVRTSSLPPLSELSREASGRQAQCNCLSGCIAPSVMPRVARVGRRLGQPRRGMRPRANGAEKGAAIDPETGAGIPAMVPRWSQGRVGLAPSRGGTGVVPLQLLDSTVAVALGDALQDALVLFDGGRCRAWHLEVRAPHGARHEVE